MSSQHLLSEEDDSSSTSSSDEPYRINIPPYNPPSRIPPPPPLPPPPPPPPVRRRRIRRRTSQPEMGAAETSAIQSALREFPPIRLFSLQEDPEININLDTVTYHQHERNSSVFAGLLDWMENNQTSQQDYDLILERTLNASMYDFDSMRTPDNRVIQYRLVSGVDVEIDDICPICRDVVSPSDLLYQLDCNHVFHHQCLLTWVGYRRTCPICIQLIRTLTPPLPDHQS